MYEFISASLCRRAPDTQVVISVSHRTTKQNYPQFDIQTKLGCVFMMTSQCPNSPNSFGSCFICHLWAAFWFLTTSEVGHHTKHRVTIFRSAMWSSSSKHHYWTHSYHLRLSYLPLTRLIYPCVPDVQAPTPWPLNCKDSRREAPSSLCWCFPTHGSTTRKTREVDCEMQFVVIKSISFSPTNSHLRASSGWVEVHIFAVCYYLRHLNVVCWPYGGFLIAARIKFECCCQHHT